MSFVCLTRGDYFLAICSFVWVRPHCVLMHYLSCMVVLLIFLEAWQNVGCYCNIYIYIYKRKYLITRTLAWVLIRLQVNVLS